MREKVSFVPRHLLDKAMGLGQACPEAFELPSCPAHQRQVDVPEQRLQCRRSVSPVVPNPPPQEWIEPLRDILQRQVRLSAEFQGPDRGPYVLQRSGADRWIEPPEQLLGPGILNQSGPKTVAEKVEHDDRILRVAFNVLTVDNPGFVGMQF